MDEYLADRDRWSNTAIKIYLDKGPRAAWLYLNGELEIPDTKDKRIGRLFHHALLQPEDWAKRLYPPEPERPEGANGKAKKDTEAKQIYNEWKAECDAWKADIKPDSLVVDPDELELVQSMREGVLRAANERAADGDMWLADMLAAPGLIEQTVHWLCPFTGLPLKARWDKAIPNAGVIIDLKSAKNWLPEEWARFQSMKYRYHLQAHLYSDAFEAVYGKRPRFFFLVVHKEKPFECALYELGDQEMELGMNQARRAMEDIAKRMADNRWHCIEERGICRLSYPAYAHMDEEAKAS